MEAGEATIVLKNQSGNYWQLNTGGAYYPNVIPKKRVNIRATYGSTYDLYTGYAEGWNPSWQSESGGLACIVNLECSDVIKFLANFGLNDAVGYAQELSGTRIGNVLDDIGFPAADRDLDAGKSQMQATGALSDEPAMEHLFVVQQSELGIIYQAGDGDLQFEDRHHRLLNHTTSLATFGDDVGEEHYHGLDPRNDDEFIKNDIRITREGGSQQSASDATSQTKFGPSTLSRTGLLMTTDAEAADQANYLLKSHKDEQLRPKTLRINAVRNPASLWAKVLGYEISDRITLRRNEAFIDQDFHIEGITHDIDLQLGTWSTYWELSAADNEQYWILGTVGFSELGTTTYLAY